MTEKINMLNLLDFGIVGDQIDFGELMHSAYVKGKEDYAKELQNDFLENLQSAAQSSSLLKSKLDQLGINVSNMYLKIIRFNSFKCLVLINNEDFFDKDKRWQSYKLSQDINSTNNRIDLKFLFMSNSDDVNEDNITADGFVIKYGSKTV